MGPRTTRNWLATMLVGVISASACGTGTGNESMENDTVTLGIINELHPAPNLVTGGQPSQAQFEQAAGEIRTVINLRASGEDGFDEAPRVEALGMRYVAIPVQGAAGVTEANARLLDSALNEGGPTLVHCASGNRVGALLALRAFYIQGASPSEALEIGQAGGLTSLEQTVTQHLETAAR